MEITFSEGQDTSFPVPTFMYYDVSHVNTINNMEVTPAIARMLLLRNKNNRKTQDWRVTEYAGRIERGEWLLNGECIKVAFDGKLLDGQKRLKAVILSGLPIHTNVTYGLHPDSQKTVDGGQKRSQADFLHMNGYEDSHRLAALINLAWRYEQGNIADNHRIVRPTTEQTLDFAKWNRKLLYRALTHGSTLTSKIPQAVMTGSSTAWYLISQVNAGDLEDFWPRLVTGDHQIDKDPIWVLRERIIRGYKKPGGVKSKYPSAILLALMLKAFRFHVLGLPITQLKFDIELEPYPAVAPPMGEETNTAAQEYNEEEIF